MSTNIDWYKIANLDYIEESDLPSRDLTLFLGTLGEKVVTLTRGNMTSILFDDIFLSINLNEKNPFIFENYSVWVDDADDIWLGLLNES